MYFGYEFVNIKPPGHITNLRLEDVAIEDLMDYEKSALYGRGKTPWINIGCDNNLYEYDENLLMKSGIARACISFLESAFNTEIIFEGNDAEQAYNIYDKFKLDHIKNRAFCDLQRSGGGGIQILWGRNASGVIEPKEVFYTDFKYIRLSRPEENKNGLLYPKSVYTSKAWPRTFRTSYMGTKVKGPFPICGSNYKEFGSDFDKNNLGDLPSYYYLKSVDSHQFLRYYPLPVYHSETGLNAIWQEYTMTRLRSSLAANAMLLDYIIVIRRPYIKDENNPNAESDRRQQERAMIEERTKVENQGKVMCVWVPMADNVDPNIDPIEFKKVPKVESHEFWKEMEDKNLTRLRTIFNITNPSFIGMPQEGSAFNSQEQVMIHQYRVMESGVGKSYRKPIVSFLNWFMSQFNLDVRARFKTSDFMINVLDVERAKKIARMEGNKESRNFREGRLDESELQVDE